MIMILLHNYLVGTSIHKPYYNVGINIRKFVEMKNIIYTSKGIK